MHIEGPGIIEEEHARQESREGGGRCHDGKAQRVDDREELVPEPLEVDGADVRHPTMGVSPLVHEVNDQREAVNGVIQPVVVEEAQQGNGIQGKRAQGRDLRPPHDMPKELRQSQGSPDLAYEGGGLQGAALGLDVQESLARRVM